MHSNSPEPSVLWSSCPAPGKASARPWDPAPSLGWGAMEATVGTGTDKQQTPLLELWHRGAPLAPAPLPLAQVPLGENFS